MKNKNVIITGGMGALGTSVVNEALLHGALPKVTYFIEQEKNRLHQFLGDELFNQVDCVFTDANDEKSVKSLIDNMNKVDVLIHLIGGFDMGATDEYAFERWHQQIDLNLKTTFLFIKHSLRRMKENGYGRIVTVGSRAAMEPAGQMAAYCAAKAGVIALTKSVADETKGINITANVVLPSVIDTPANRKAMGDKNAPKWVKPESLAKTICYLASEAAGDIRGAAIPVYGNV